MERWHDGAPWYAELSHTADVGFVVTAPDLPSLFARAGVALLAAVVEPASVRLVSRWPVSATAAGDDATLLHAWLSTLVLELPVHGRVGAGIDAVTLAPGRVEAIVAGEAVYPARHVLHGEVKAVTWHGFALERISTGWRAQVILDV
jgi:SHS2 domain-containing protein